MITLYTSPTPNGWKASIALEELELPYRVHRVRLGRGEQKEDWFLRLNPNGRIPVIVDHDEDDFPVFESGAILVYLAEKAGRLLPAERRARSRVMQWLMFQMGGVGPMMGQLNVFRNYAPERLEYAIGRYDRECRRLFGVLERQLGDHEYLAGEYSVADIATWSWVHRYERSGLDVEGLEALQRWLAAVGGRPAVVRGRAVPEVGSEPTREQVVQVGRSMLV